jgi:hypothetical protein
VCAALQVEADADRSADESADGQAPGARRTSIAASGHLGIAADGNAAWALASKPNGCSRANLEGMSSLGMR